MKMFLTFLFISSLLTNGFSQPGSATDSISVQQVVIKLFDGIAGIDSTEIVNQVTKDFLLLEDGQIWNSDSLIKVLKPRKTQDFKRTNEFHFVSQQIVGNMSWLVYYNTAHIVFNGQKRDVDWLESAVLVKEDNIWKVKMLHSTMLRKPPGK